MAMLSMLDESTYHVRPRRPHASIRLAVMTSSTRLLPSMIVVTEAVAVLCQFIQHTDPRFPLVYFTVLSGVLAGLVAALEVTSRPCGLYGDGARLTAAVGVVVSAIIFAALIAPASPTGTWFQPWDDVWVRIATVLFHGVGPILVVADLVLRRPRLTVAQWFMTAYSWPVTYLLALAVAATTFDVTIPYPFLSPSEMGWSTVSIAITSLAAAICVVAALLYSVPAIGHRRRT